MSDSVYNAVDELCGGQSLGNGALHFLEFESEGDVVPNHHDAEEQEPAMDIDAPGSINGLFTEFLCPSFVFMSDSVCIAVDVQQNGAVNSMEVDLNGSQVAGKHKLSDSRLLTLSLSHTGSRASNSVCFLNSVRFAAQCLFCVFGCCTAHTPIMWCLGDMRMAFMPTKVHSLSYALMRVSCD